MVHVWLPQVADNSSSFLGTVFFYGTASIKKDPGSPDSATLVSFSAVSQARDYSLLCSDQYCTTCLEETGHRSLDTVSYAKRFFGDLYSYFVERFPSGYGTSGDVAGA